MSWWLFFLSLYKLQKVSAGGNTGAVGFGLGFRQLSHKNAFLIMGFTLLRFSLLSIFINIKGYPAFSWGKYKDVSKETGTLALPERNEEDSTDVNAYRHNKYNRYPPALVLEMRHKITALIFSLKLVISRFRRVGNATSTPLEAI